MVLYLSEKVSIFLTLETLLFLWLCSPAFLAKLFADPDSQTTELFIQTKLCQLISESDNQVPVSEDQLKSPPI